MVCFENSLNLLPAFQKCEYMGQILGFGCWCSLNVYSTTNITGGVRGVTRIFYESLSHPICWDIHWSKRSDNNRFNLYGVINLFANVYQTDAGGRDRKKITNSLKFILNRLFFVLKRGVYVLDYLVILINCINKPLI